jgi:hypothetical protein
MEGERLKIFAESGLCHQQTILRFSTGMWSPTHQPVHTMQGVPESLPGPIPQYLPEMETLASSQDPVTKYTSPWALAQGPAVCYCFKLNTREVWQQRLRFKVSRCSRAWTMQWMLCGPHTLPGTTRTNDMIITAVYYSKLSGTPCTTPVVAYDQTCLIVSDSVVPCAYNCQRLMALSTLNDATEKSVF